MEGVLNRLSARMVHMLNAEEHATLATAIGETANVVGMHAFIIGIDKRHPRDFMFSPDITTSLERDFDDYLSLGFDARDPLLNHVREGRPALAWDTDSMAGWDDPGVPEYLEFLRWKTIRGGVTVPLGSAPDKYTAITFTAVSDDFKTVKGSISLATIIGAAALSKAAQLGAAPSGISSSREPLRRLSGWQMEILSWIAAGKSNAEIGMILGISKGRVDYQVSQILKALNVATRIQAAAIYSSQ